MKGVILAHVNTMSTLISCTYASLVALSELSGELTKHYVAWISALRWQTQIQSQKYDTQGSINST